MRSFNWNSIDASSDGDFTPLPAGGYVAKITDMVDNEDKENVEVIFDIAEGEHAGYYSDDFGKSHPYNHHFYLSYRTDGGLRMTKGRLQNIQKSNPGFDPFAAWDAGRLDMFKGRLLGINLQEEEYENRDGEVKVRLNVCQVVDAQLVRDGKVKPRKKKEIAGKMSTAPSASADAMDDIDVPFV
jgi:hypothetical protein